MVVSAESGHVTSVRTPVYVLFRFAVALIPSLIILASWHLRLWPVDYRGFLFYVGVFFGLMLVVLTLSLWKSAGFRDLLTLREAENAQQKRLGGAFLLLLAGTSCTMVAIVWHIFFPSHLRFLSAVRMYSWDSVNPLFFLEGSPVLLFLFAWGITISAIALGQMWVVSRQGQLEDSHRYSRVCRDFGFVLLEVGAFLPLSTAGLNYITTTFSDSSPAVGFWVFPYWPHGAFLVLISSFFLVATLILAGLPAYRRNALGLWKLVATALLVLTWLLAPYWFTFVFSFSPLFLATETAVRYAHA